MSFNRKGDEWKRVGSYSHSENISHTLQNIGNRLSALNRKFISGSRDVYELWYDLQDIKQDLNAIKDYGGLAANQRNVIAGYQHLVSEYEIEIKRRLKI